MSHRYFRSEGRGPSYTYADFEDRKKSEIQKWLLQHQDIRYLVDMWKKFERWTFSLSTRMQTLVWGSLLLAIIALIFFGAMQIPAGLMGSLFAR